MNPAQNNGNELKPTLTFAEPPSVLAPPKLASILIPCVGQLEYTKLCVPSVLRHSRRPFELIFIDIGSLDGTAEYLAGLAAGASVRVEVVRTATDLGIKDAIREALNQAQGEYLVLLNNDTVVGDGWLTQLTNLAGARDQIGMVGPMSNYAIPPQQVESVPYRIGPRKGPAHRWGMPQPLVDTEAVNDFAKEFRQQHRKAWTAVDSLGGFCVLVKREVLKKIEQTSALRDWGDLGLFDTDILSLKARQAGFTLACAQDLFIHNFRSRIFAHGAPSGPEHSPNSSNGETVRRI
jgi:GT2 family glycosyltransferase